MSRKRLLFVTSRFPYPPIGGDRLRVTRLLSQLTKTFDVTLISRGSPSEADRRDLITETGITELCCIPHPLFGALAGSVGALVSGVPLQVGYYGSRAVDQMVARLAPKHDLCIFHLIRTSSVWQNQAKVPSVLEMCDAVSANFEQRAAEGTLLSPWRLISMIEARRTAKFERSEIDRFDLVTMHTHSDAKLVGIADERLLVSTQGVDISDLPWVSPEKRTGRSVAIIGKMDAFPNWHGALWFAREVLPLLPSDIRLKVIGHCPPGTRARFKDFPRVDVTGTVASLEEACRDCFAGIAPMFVATGIQNKVLQYFAMGLPVVVTSAVAHGLSGQAEGTFRVAETKEEWVSHLLDIASRLAVTVVMAEHARAYVERYHSWDRIGAEYVERLNKLLCFDPGR